MSRKIASILVVLGCACLEMRALAFSAQGHRWANQAGSPVIYRLHPDGSDDISDGSDLDAVRRAFATWGGVACSYLSFGEQAWSEPRIVANDGVNRIFFVEAENEWRDPPGTLALTYTFYRLDQPIITDSDMRINGVSWHYTTRDGEIGTGTPAKVDLETVVFHEAGHFLGLDHSSDPSAAMFPSANKPKQRTPANDDVQGVCTLYSNGSQIPGGGNGGGAVGAPCLGPNDCRSTLCADDQQLGRRYCTASCGDTMPCPSGYSCEMTAQGKFCLAPVVPDELCDQCDVGNQCASGFCVQVTGVNGEHPFCSRPCDPTPGQPAQCPGGFSCVPLRDATLGGACAPNNGVCEPKGKGGQNEACFGNGTCKAGFRCVDFNPDAPQLGLRFCYYACAPEYIGQSCTANGGTQCLAAQGFDTNDVAVCFGIAHEGQPCIPETCDSTSFCAYDQSVDDALCYRLCQTQNNCPVNTQCQQFPGLPSLCVPLNGFKFEGQACAADTECKSQLCRTYGQNRLCTSVCAPSDPASCGAGLKCLPEAGSSRGFCWPESFRDPSASDPSRSVGSMQQNFCACDTTRACEKDCRCDPECASAGGCGCSSTTSKGDARGAMVALAGLMLLAACRRGPRRALARAPRRA